MHKNLTIKEKITLALENHKKKYLKIAENYYKDILKISPNHFEANYLLGLLLLQKENFEGSKNFFKSHQKLIQRMQIRIII